MSNSLLSLCCINSKGVDLVRSIGTFKLEYLPAAFTGLDLEYAPNKIELKSKLWCFWRGFPAIGNTFVSHFMVVSAFLLQPQFSSKNSKELLCLAECMTNPSFSFISEVLRSKEEASALFTLILPLLCWFITFASFMVLKQKESDDDTMFQRGLFPYPLLSITMRYKHEIFLPDTIRQQYMCKTILTFLVNWENKALLLGWDLAQKLNPLLESSREVRDWFLVKWW